MTVACMHAYEYQATKTALLAAQADTSGSDIFWSTPPDPDTEPASSGVAWDDAGAFTELEALAAWDEEATNRSSQAAPAGGSKGSNAGGRPPVKGLLDDLDEGWLSGEASAPDALGRDGSMAPHSGRVGSQEEGGSRERSTGRGRGRGRGQGRTPGSGHGRPRSSSQ